MTEANRRNSFWSALLVFGQRDIRSFFKNTQGPIMVPDIPNPHQIPSADPVTPLPPLLDVMQLEHVRCRRKTLDWRDETIVKLSSTGRDSLEDFTDHVNDMLEDVPI